MSRPHGLAGEVSVQLATAFPERFRAGDRILWRRGDATRTLTLAEARPHGKRWRLRFDGVATPEAARELSGGDLFVESDEAFPAPPGYYYSHDVEGWPCVDASGRSLGVVARLEQMAAGPMLTVRTDGGREVLVPFVETIVSEVDRRARRIVLDPPEGLFEL